MQDKISCRFALFFALMGLAVLLTGSPTFVQAAESGAALTPEEAYRQLVAGNASYLGQATDAARQLPKLPTTEDRFPIATILYSSDIPKTPDVLTGLTNRDLYLVPIEMGAFASSQLGDYEYGVVNLHTPLAVVLTHYPSKDLLDFIGRYDQLSDRAKKEATKAAETKTWLSTETSDDDHDLELYNLVGPAIARAREAYPDLKGDEFANVVAEAVAWQSIEAILMQSSTTLDRIRNGSLDLIAAVADDSTGQIYWLGSHPIQDEFLKPVPEEVQAKKVATDGVVTDETELTEPLPDTVINNYITEYETNNYYDNVVDDYFVTPCPVRPYWGLFGPQVWHYRPWYGIWVDPFTPWPYYQPWSPSVWGGTGFSVFGGHVNFFIGFGGPAGPPIHYGPDFRPHDPWWGRDPFRPHPGPIGPGPHPGPVGPIGPGVPGHRPGISPGFGPGQPGMRPGISPGMDRPGMGDRPGMDRPGMGNRPGMGDQPGKGTRPGRQPGEGNTGTRPGRQPGEDAGNQPGMGNRPGSSRPGVEPGRINDGQQGTRPGRQPGEGNTGTRPGRQPGEGNTGTRPGRQPGEGNTGTRPGRQPGEGNTGTRPGRQPGEGNIGGGPNFPSSRRDNPSSVRGESRPDRGGESPVTRSPGFTGSREVSGPGASSGLSNRAGSNRGGTSPVYRSPGGTGSRPGNLPSGSNINRNLPNPGRGASSAGRGGMPNPGRAGGGVNPGRSGGGPRPGGPGR